ncbi:hypothetical protein BGX30_010139 [Mortierella sp. GBA39]|nr:hypothetical protein BGX30_010139 [Mortierella sp. GBA39]
MIREIRAVSKVPILFLSSRDHPMDMVMAMNMGADDYVQKPFHMDVLLAKIQAVLRRTYAYGEEAMDVIEWNGALLDLKRGVIRRDGREAELTKNEFYILTVLVEAKDEIVTRQDLIRKLWEDEHFVNDNTLTANITRLRQKLALLELDGAIITKKGIGYMAGSSFVYLNLLFLLAFIGFFIWRYLRETKYISQLDALARDMQDGWLEALPRPEYVRDETVDDVLRAADLHYKRKISDLKKTWLVQNDMTASWIHEVKAPLTAMKLAIDAHPRDPVMRTLEAEWLRLHLLVDRQLYITRLPSLESDYVPEETVIQRLAAKEVRELASWCMAKNLAVEFEGDEAQVTTDSKWCRFMIRQILINAVKYSPEGGTIWIASERMPAGNVVLVIKDEGPGIPAHDLPRIFDKGFTGGNGRLHNAATGLGLYLARVVGDRIGVTLEAESAPGKGTAMRLIFTAANAYEKVQKERYR